MSPKENQKPSHIICQCCAHPAKMFCSFFRPAEQILREFLVFRTGGPQKYLCCRTLD